MVIKQEKIDYLHLPEGTILNDKYLIKRRLVAKSNLSTIYIALNQVTREKVIIKEFFPQELVLRDLDGKKVFPKDSEVDLLAKKVESFLVEAKIMQEIEHRYIGQCYNCFKENNTGYIVLKYYQGLNLAAYFEKHQLDLAEFLDAIFYPLLDAVEDIHAHGYLHRDLKPTNIIYSSTPILIDFGSAIEYKKSKPKRRVITPGYSPLEFHTKETEQKPSADIYSLAAILYYYFTLQAPIPVKKRIIEDNLTSAFRINTSLSKGLNKLIMKNLSLEAEERDQSITEFRLNLKSESFKIKSKKIIKSFLTIF